MTDAQAMGYRLAIHPGACLGAAIMAVDAVLAKLKGVPPATANAGGGPMALFRRFGADEWDALRRRYDAEAVVTPTGPER